MSAWHDRLVADLTTMNTGDIYTLAAGAMRDVDTLLVMLARDEHKATGDTRRSDRLTRTLADVCAILDELADRSDTLDDVRALARVQNVNRTNGRRG